MNFDKLTEIPDDLRGQLEAEAGLDRLDEAKDALLRSWKKFEQDMEAEHDDD